MSLFFGAPIDLGQSELQNAVIQNLAAEPSSPVEGQIFVHTGTDLLGYYNGAAWVYVGGGASTVDVTDSTDTTCWLMLAESQTGNQAVKSDGGLTYNASTGVLTATGLAGPLTGNVTGNLTGNVTGNVTGSSGSCTGNAATATLAATVTVADSTDATSFIAMFDSATGNLAIKTDAGLTYDSTTATLTVGGDAVISGDLTVNGNVLTVNTTTSTVEDPLIELGSSNAADSVDLGFYANYMPVATPLFTGLFRDASDSGKWKLFKDSQTEPTTTVNIGATGYAVATLVANIEGAVTGNASTATALATARSIYGNNFDGTAALAQIIASTFGGTGNGFTKFSGPATSEKTFTLPNASATVLTDNAAVTVLQGGTGRATSTTAYALLAAGTTATGAHQTLAAGATTEILVGGGAAALPVWTTATGSGAPVRATSPTLVTPILGTPTSGTLTNCTGPWMKTPYSALIGNGALTSITITQATHGMATSCRNIVQIFNATTGAQVYCDVTVAPGTGDVTFAFTTAPASNAYRVVISG